MEIIVMTYFKGLKKIGVNTTVLATSVALVACGGGGYYGNNNSSGDNNSNGNNTGGNQSETDTSKVADSLNIILQDTEGKTLQIAQDNSQVKVAVKVLNVDKGGVAGKDVRLSIADSDKLGVASTNSKVTSDANGVAVFTLNIPVLQADSGKVQLTAVVDGTKISIPYTLNIKKTTTIVSDYNLSVPQGATLNLPNGSVDLPVVVTDTKGGAKAGQTIELSLPQEMNGKFAIEPGSSITTDSQGKATFKIIPNAGLTAGDISAFIGSSQKLTFKLIDENRAEKQEVTSLTFKDTSKIVNVLEVITPEASIKAKAGTAKVRVFAKNSNGDVLSNTKVKLAVDAIADSYGVKLDKIEAITNTQGYAEFTLTSNSDYPIALAQHGIELTATYTENSQNINGKATVQVVTADETVEDQEAIQRLEVASSYKVNAVDGVVEVKVKAVNFKGLGASKGKITLSLNSEAQSNGVTFEGAATRDINENGFVTFKLKTITSVPKPTQKTIDALVNAGIIATFKAGNNVENKIEISVEDAAISTEALQYLQIDPILESFDPKKDQTITVKVKAIGIKGSPLKNEKILFNSSNEQLQSLGLSLKDQAEKQTDDTGYTTYTFEYKYNTKPEQQNAANEGILLTFSSISDSAKTQAVKLNFATRDLPELDYLSVDTDGVKSIVLGVEKLITVRVKAVNKQGNALTNQEVGLSVTDSISLTKGVSYGSPTKVTTDSNGTAIFNLKVKPQNQSDFNTLMQGIDIKITPTGADTKSVSRHIELSALTVDAEVDSKVEQLMIDPIVNAYSSVQNQNIVVRTKALDNKGNPLVNARVNITPSLSNADMKTLQLSLVSQAEQITDAEGYVTFTYSYKYDGTPEQAVLAHSGVEFTVSSAITNKIDKVGIKFTSLPKVLDYLNVAISNYAVTLNGTAKVITITVDAKDIDGNVLPGQVVGIGLNEAALPNGVTLLTPTSKVTDSNGKATFQINIDPKTATQIDNLDANDLTVAIVGKRPDGTQYSAVQKIELSKPTVVLQDLANLEITSVNPNLSVLGGETRVKVIAKDAAGNAIPNTPITVALSSLVSSRVSLSGVPTTTNSKGEAEFTVTVSEGKYDESLIKNGIIFAIVGTNLNNGDRLQQTSSIGITAPANALNPRLVADVKTVTAGQTVKVYASVKDEMGLNTAAGIPMRLSLNSEATAAGVKLSSEAVVIQANGSVAVDLIIPKGVSSATLSSIVVTGIIRDPRGNEIPTNLTFTVQDAINPYHLTIDSNRVSLSSAGDTALVTVKLLDSNQGGVANQPVTLSIADPRTATSIKGSSQIVTNEFGEAVFELSMKAVAGLVSPIPNIVLTATHTNENGVAVSQNSQLQVHTPTALAPQLDLKIKASKDKLNVRGDAVDVSVLVTDMNGSSQSGKAVTLTIPAYQQNGAYIKGASTLESDTNGWVKFTVVIDESLRATGYDFVTNDLVVEAVVKDTQNTERRQSYTVDVVPSEVPVTIGSIDVNVNPTQIGSTNNGIYYTLEGSVQLLDVDGKPVANQDVVLDTRPTSYSLGKWLFAIQKDPWDRTVTPFKLKGEYPFNDLKAWVKPGDDYYALSGATPDLGTTNNTVYGCAINPASTSWVANGKALRVVRLIGSDANHPATATYRTDNYGRFDFQIEYPKANAHWLNVQIGAKATLAQTPVRGYTNFTLPALKSDFATDGSYAPNEISPYNTQSMTCSD